MNYLSLGDLNDIFFEVTCSIYGIDHTAHENQGKIRRTWPKAGQPTFDSVTDMTFYRILFEDDEYNRQREMKFEAVYNGSTEDNQNITQIMQMTNVNRIYWTIYGPNSMDNAWRIWNQLYYQSTKNILAARNIYLVPDIAAPRRVPEPFQSLWWERHDLEVKFNSLIVINSLIPTILTAPVGVTADSDTINNPGGVTISANA